MGYYELREKVRILAGRVKSLKLPSPEDCESVTVKGRKQGYKQFDVLEERMKVNERLMPLDYESSCMEVSLRAHACPLPFNLDTYDSLVCPYRCVYCFANYARASLYPSMFDNGKSLAIRKASSARIISDFDKVLAGEPGANVDGSVKNAIKNRIPVRFGIRYEDFLPIEGKEQIALRVLQHLAKIKYPVMINTKSNLVGRDDYVEALSDNTSAVHITLISSDEKLLKLLEPGAPTFKERIKAAKALTDAGVRVVARIEPFMVFVNDDPDFVRDYMDQIREAGIKHLTFDSYSYSAVSQGMVQIFASLAFDFRRMFTLMSDSQWLGSYILNSFMEMFRKEGFNASTFDFGSAASNSQHCCCEVGDLFDECLNYGNLMTAGWFIKGRAGKVTNWKDFEKFVESKGGFLSDKLKLEVHEGWNMEGLAGYNLEWWSGLKPMGNDDYGLCWSYTGEDFREDFLNSVIERG